MEQDGGAVTRRRARPVSELDALRIPPHSVEAEQAVGVFVEKHVAQTSPQHDAEGDDKQQVIHHGGVERRLFELYALAASIVGKCHFCVQSHYALLKESGMSVDQLRDVGRIAAVIAAAANAMAVEEPAFA